MHVVFGIIFMPISRLSVTRLHAHSLSRWGTISNRYIEKHALELLKSESIAYHFKSLISPRSIQSRFDGLSYPIWTASNQELIQRAQV